MAKSPISKFILPLISTACFSPASFALLINLNDIGGAAPGSQAGIAFQQAALVWESVITDPIEINLDIGFSALASNTLGSASSSSQNALYSNVRNALINDATSIDDQTAIANLQAGPYFNFLSSESNGSQIFDNNNTTNNQYLSVNTANLKALGLLGATTSSDASITFNNTINFDFDVSDGVTSGFYDFVGIAIHEIGHALGFVSGVDTIDQFSGSGPSAGAIPSFDPYSIHTTLDLFRYSADSAPLGIGVPDLAIGDRNQYFSIDGGVTPLALFATGRYNGDGRQASHWKDNLGIGLLDPTFTSGEIGQLSVLDLLSIDIIGFDIELPVEINNTSTLWLFILALATLVGYKHIPQRLHKRLAQKSKN